MLFMILKDNSTFSSYDLRKDNRYSERFNILQNNYNKPLS